DSTRTRQRRGCVCGEPSRAGVLSNTITETHTHTVTHAHTHAHAHAHARTHAHAHAHAYANPLCSRKAPHTPRHTQDQVLPLTSAALAVLTLNAVDMRGLLRICFCALQVPLIHHRHAPTH